MSSRKFSVEFESTTSYYTESNTNVVLSISQGHELILFLEDQKSENKDIYLRLNDCILVSTTQSFWIVQ